MTHLAIVVISDLDTADQYPIDTSNQHRQHAVLAVAQNRRLRVPDDRLNCQGEHTSFDFGGEVLRIGVRGSAGPFGVAERPHMLYVAHHPGLVSIGQRPQSGEVRTAALILDPPIQVVSLLDAAAVSTQGVPVLQQRRRKSVRIVLHREFTGENLAIVGVRTEHGHCDRVGLDRGDELSQEGPPVGDPGCLQDDSSSMGPR